MPEATDATQEALARSTLHTDGWPLTREPEIVFELLEGRVQALLHFLVELADDAGKLYNDLAVLRVFGCPLHVLLK